MKLTFDIINAIFQIMIMGCIIARIIDGIKKQYKEGISKLNNLSITKK